MFKTNRLWTCVFSIFLCFSFAEAGQITPGSIARITGGTVRGSTKINTTYNVSSAANFPHTETGIFNMSAGGGLFETYLLSYPSSTPSVIGPTLNTFATDALRNYTTGETIGNISGLVSNTAGCGHYSTVPGFTGTTTSVKCYVAVMRGQTGTISTLIGYDTLLISGGTISSTIGYKATIPSGAGRFNFYGSGTADNAFAGNVRIGSVVAPTVALDVTGNSIISGAFTVGGYAGIGSLSNIAGLSVSPSGLSGVNQYGVLARPIITSAATTSAVGIFGGVYTADGAYTVADLIQVQASQQTKGVGVTITNQHGVLINEQTQGTNNYGITNQVTSGANKWAYYGSGTANNAFAGNTRFGGVTAPTVAVDVSGAIAASTTVKTGGYTVAALPACAAGQIGTFTYVTDAAAPAWNVAVAGGGAIVTPVFCNGVAWVAH